MCETEYWGVTDCHCCCRMLFDGKRLAVRRAPSIFSVFGAHVMAACWQVKRGTCRIAIRHAIWGETVSCQELELQHG